MYCRYEYTLSFPYTCICTCTCICICVCTGARARVALTGLTVAEYFRDQEGQDVLLFIDNIFRFTQAGSEVSKYTMNIHIHVHV